MRNRIKPLNENDMKHIRTTKQDLAKKLCSEEIPCFKFHYTMEKDYKKTDRCQSVLRFVDEGREVEIHNYRQTHQGFALTRSKAGFRLD